MSLLEHQRGYMCKMLAQSRVHSVCVTNTRCVIIISDIISISGVDLPLYVITKEEWIIPQLHVIILGVCILYSLLLELPIRKKFVNIRH